MAVCAALRWATASGRTNPEGFRGRHLLFPVRGGSTCSLAIQDQTDVGVSGALHTGVCFFGRLNAVSAIWSYGWGRHERRGPEQQRFHVLRSIRDGFRSVLYIGSAFVRVGSR